MPPDALSVTGKVTNEQNELLDTVTVSAAEFEKNGWKYEPKEPGLYYVEFEAKTPNGSISLGEEYMERAMDNRIGLYEQKRQAFAVIPPRRSDGTATPPVFGYQVGYSPNSTRGETEVELIRRAGADFARFHVTWFEIEPEKGKFDWAGLDRLVDKCVKAGIKPVICFYGTPRWASNTPDDTRYVVHVWAYNAYAAKDVNDWTNFVGQLVKRYGDRVDTWEVWNEPHLRNYSCYWHDTPENYVMLLKSAYQTIKKLQPESKVWIGGMALRYLPFYEAIMKLGAGPYFDYFAMHGHGQSIAPFHALDRKYGSEPHPWVSSEWHASLIRYTDAAYKLNENQRTVRMMLDFFSMVRQGAEQIAFFEPFNLVERETLKLHTEGGAPLNHCSGIFRRRPYFQPVLGAVVMATFDRALAGKIGITGTYRFGNQKAAAFTSDYGPLLVVWQETDRDEKLAPELAPVFAKANVQSWEGRPVKEPGSMTLRPHTMYFASNVTIPPEWQDRPDVLRADRPKLELEHKVRGVYGDKPLFDDNGKLIAKNVRWNNRGFKIHTMPGFEPFRKERPLRRSALRRQAAARGGDAGRPLPPARRRRQYVAGRRDRIRVRRRRRRVCGQPGRIPRIENRQGGRALQVRQPDAGRRPADRMDHSEHNGQIRQGEGRNAPRPKDPLSGRNEHLGALPARAETGGRPAVLAHRQRIGRKEPDRAGSLGKRYLQRQETGGIRRSRSGRKVTAHHFG